MTQSLGLQGISGLVGFVDPTPEATPEQRLGGPADPAHANLGEQATPYPWEQFPGESHGPYGLDNELLGFDIYGVTDPAGMIGQDPTADLQPYTRAAPWPKGLPLSPFPEDQGPWRDQENAIHAVNMGGSREAQQLPTANPVQDDWQLIDNVTPGESMQEPIPQQIMQQSGGWGTRDRTQSQALQNGYDFGSAHMRRRFAQGSIPGNYMWMEPGQRPLVKSVAGTAKIPVGQDSPFAGQDPRRDFDPYGPALFQLPATYQAPPDPALALSYPAQDAPEVEYY